MALKESDDYSDLTPNPNRSTALEAQPEDPEVIQFYETAGEYGCFSNFSRHPIAIDGKRWPTTEHYFQAQKFAGTYHEEEIRGLEKPMEAAQAGRDRSRPLRRDWEDVKDDIMHKALTAKFSQHIDAARALLRTGDAILVEHTKNDSYWADGGNGKGKNMLGVLLMRVRRELQDRADCKQVVAEVAAEFAEEGDDVPDAGGRTHRQIKTRRKKLRARVNVYVDKDGSSKLESMNDGKGTITVVGSGGVNLPKHALPAAAQMAVLRGQFQRRFHASEDDFGDENAADEEEEDVESEYLVKNGKHNAGGNKFANYLPGSHTPPAPTAADSLDAVLASARNTTDLIADLLHHKAAPAQLGPLVAELKVKRDALAEAIGAEHPEKTIQAIIAVVEAANDVIAKSENAQP